MDGEEVRLTPPSMSLSACWSKRRPCGNPWPAPAGSVGLADTKETNYVHVYITGLRKKIEKNPRMPELILTQPGRGLPAY